MTDHNAEGGKMVLHNYDKRDVIEPCAWCGREPMVYGGSDDHVRASCDPYVCRMQSFNDWALEDWNSGQGIILAQRRKDFEAGHALAAEQEGAMTNIGFESFEDYLASTRK